MTAALAVSGKGRKNPRTPSPQRSLCSASSKKGCGRQRAAPGCSPLPAVPGTGHASRSRCVPAGARLGHRVPLPQVRLLRTGQPEPPAEPSARAVTAPRSTRARVSLTRLGPGARQDGDDDREQQDGRGRARSATRGPGAARGRGAGRCLGPRGERPAPPARPPHPRAQRAALPIAGRALERRLRRRAAAEGAERGPRMPPAALPAHRGTRGRGCSAAARPLGLRRGERRGSQLHPQRDLGAARAGPAPRPPSEGRRERGRRCRGRGDPSAFPRAPPGPWRERGEAAGAPGMGPCSLCPPGHGQRDSGSRGSVTSLVY